MYSASGSHTSSKDTGGGLGSFLYVSGIKIWRTMNITISVPAGFRYKTIDVRVSVGHALEGLRYEDSTGENILSGHFHLAYRTGLRKLLSCEDYV
jgi:hypothetical protein